MPLGSRNHLLHMAFNIKASGMQALPQYIAGSSQFTRGYRSQKAAWYAVTALLLLAPSISMAKGIRIHRSKAALNTFVKFHPCPITGKNRLPCHGYVIDHIKPLACGGSDAPDNMQWQTTIEAKIKDKWERKGCQQHP